MNSLRKPRVLIAEDDHSSRWALRSYLEIHGMDTCVAEDGAKALELIHKSPPDLLITAINLPNKDGITLIREIREKEALKDMPVIVVSSEYEWKLNRARQIGAQSVFAKPVIDLDILVDTIRELVHTRCTSAVKVGWIQRLRGKISLGKTSLSWGFLGYLEGSLTLETLLDLLVPDGDRLSNSRLREV